MGNIIPFESAKLPAHLAQIDAAAANADLLSHSGGGFPVLSIKGKVFAVVRGGERTVLPNPRDPESPATYVEVVLIKANKGTSKVFYAKGYSEGAEASAPDCFSNDGVAPDQTVENPISKKCATCPKNVWGSKISDAGTKVKACSDSVRVAVAPADRLNDPHLLRVPPASIKELGEFGAKLAKRNVGYQMVLTKIKFDAEQPTPYLKFEPVGFLDEASYHEVLEQAQSDVVQKILGTAGLTASEAEDPPATEPQRAAAPAAAKKTASKPTPAPKPPVEADRKSVV